MAKKIARLQWSRKQIGIAVAVGILLLLGAVWLLCPRHASVEGGVRCLYEGSASQIKRGTEHKGQFTVACGQIPVDVTFYKSSEKTARQLCQLLYEPLVSASAEGEVKPVLAKRVDFSSDGRSAEVTLGKHCFSDGSPVTAQDVYDAYLLAAARDTADSLRKKIAAIDGGEAYLQGTGEELTGIEILDEGKLRFTFCAPSLCNLEALTLPIVKETEMCEFPLGSGRYQMEHFSGLQEVLLTVNPYSKGQCSYQKIRFINGTRQAIEQGTADFSVDAMAVGNREIYDLAQAAGGYDIYAYPTEERAYITFAPQSSLTVRQAVCAAFDGDDFWENVDALQNTSHGNLPVSGFASPRYAGKAAFGEQMQKLQVEKLAKKLIEERGKATVTVALADTTVNRSYFGILAQQFTDCGIELQADFNGAPESCDMALSFADPRSPEEILRQTLGAAEYEAWIAQQLHKDYQDVYEALEKQAVNVVPILPIGAGANQIAVLADCRDQALLQVLMES